MEDENYSENEVNESEDSGEDEVNEEEDGEGSDEGDENDDEIEESGGVDGMADMMSKILHQQVGRKIPVLAKRKTTIMKELEKEYADRDRLKKLKIARKEARDKHLVLPHALSADYERQLRKIATRGVVALFNAIAKSKRAEHEAEGEPSSNSKQPQVKAKDVMELSRSNFLDLLKGNGSEKSESQTKNPQLEEQSSDDEQDGLGVSSWSVLKESYLTDKKLALKDWDKEEDESDLSEHDRDLDDPFTPDVSSSDKLSKKRNLNQKTNKGKKPKVSGGKKR